MKSFLRCITLGLMLIAPVTALAQAPTVSAISDLSLNEGTTQNVPVVAFSAGTAITLTASLPSFATLNAPTTGTGLVSTTITLSPAAGTTGTFNGSVTATSGELSSTETFQIVVNAAGTNKAPVVVAPAVQNVTTGALLTFSVTATDSEAITTLGASGLPSGATFTPDAPQTAGTFSWTPGAGQTGDYDVVFTASNTMSGSATTHIHVTAGNHPPTLDAPATRTVTEGNTLAFTVTGTDQDGDHVTLTTGALPSGASATDQGNNTLNFSWQPNTSQAGTYTVTFHGDDGHGGTVDATTTITVLDSGGGGGGTGGVVTLIGKVNTHSGRTCFRIEPVNGSFDPTAVNLSSFTLHFNGTILHAIAGRTHVLRDCEGEGDDGDGDCDNGDHDDAARILRGDGHGHGHGDGEGDDDDDDCDSCNDDGDANCDAVGIRACFSTGELVHLFCDSLDTSLADATIHFTLNDGTEIVATFSGPIATHGNGHKHKMDAMAKPNPLNPRTVLSFTLSQPGRVQVNVYDLQGRLVNKLSDEVRGVGPQSLVWDGSNSRNGHVSSGVYFFRIQAPEGQVVQRVAVVK